MYNIRYQRNTVGGKRTISWWQLVVELLRRYIMKSTFIG